MGTKSRQVPMKRPGQPAELATTYVMLAEPMSSYVSGTTVGRDRRQTFHLNDGRPPASDQPEGWYFVVRGKLWQLAIEVSVLRCDPH